MSEREPIDLHFESSLRSHRPGATPHAAADQLWRIFRAQAGSRLLDFQARIMRAAGTGYYTIGSAGHESNAYVAAALRPTDPAFLHYRSGAFYLARAEQVDGVDGVRDVLLSLAASTADPISGGRHKVFGRHELAIVPTTSTIGSHLPRAMGVAFAIGRARKLAVPCAWPDDAICIASFGDASANHASSVSAINTAIQTAYQGLPMPLLMVCEDNGIGISVRTPRGWIATAYGERPGLRYFTGSGDNPDQMVMVARDAADYVRRTRKPAFLHLRTVRFMAHAGSDAEVAYRSAAEIEADYARDPLLATARSLVDAGTSPDEGIAEYEQIRTRVAEIADEVVALPKLRTAEEVIGPLAASRPAEVAERAGRPAAPDRRAELFEGRLPEAEGPLTLSQSINRALVDSLAAYDAMLVFGEDVGRKGGVYGTTARLQRRAGIARVFDTLLDETSILGLALGLGVSGLLPVPEIQYLAYLHNAIDQIRGEAATAQFFSEGRYRNGMMVRIQGLAYQKGFGGHFHNDNSVAALCDIPGLVVAVPSRGDDAAAMVRTLLAAADVDGTVSAFVEPIALYHSRDLFSDGDGGLLSAYAAPEQWADGHIAIGQARHYIPDSSAGESDLTIVTFGNGVPMSLRVADRLNQEGHVVRVLDLRWLRPLPLDALRAEAATAKAILVADETRCSGGVSESVCAALVDLEYGGQLARVTSRDSFVPLADAANLVLLGEETIEEAARQMLQPQPHGAHLRPI
ncbi:thiamine pyrophosphate-dependent enzyme [Blastococcus sp. Marseille-P5729]|uniref:thiamine pyrophosphate-dependent enzyme n=1 Tax=Blastococcus sp. Marseille-P5729 TaxID=2086582 RepID=UPI001F412D64|nr:thiamine pyrophosphate-dependent enzyme [Blastococcus sp. Marseille-P5729]